MRERSREQTMSKIVSQEEPALLITPSYTLGEYRYRPVFNGLYKRPKQETFHEFLVHLVKWTFGEIWWKQQVGMNESKRHIILSWNYILTKFQRRNMNEDNKLEDGVTYEADAPGPVWSLITFGYDLFCLRAKNLLPDHLVDRLKKNNSFQSARYEVLVAALMLRYGFDIQFLDNLKLKEKHCEFIAIHEGKNLRIGVETKSRVHGSKYGEINNYNSDTESRAFQALLRKAIKQLPEKLPSFIFIDVNSPLTPKISINEKPWFKDMRRVVGSMLTPTADSPDPFTAIVITNFAFHFEDMANPTAPAEYGLIVPKYSKNPLPDISWINELMTNLNRHPRVPFEI